VSDFLRLMTIENTRLSALWSVLDFPMPEDWMTEMCEDARCAKDRSERQEREVRLCQEVLRWLYCDA
jgi:hypothetical protein